MPRPTEPMTSQVMLATTMIFSTRRPTMLTAVPTAMMAIAMEAVCHRPALDAEDLEQEAACGVGQRAESAMVRPHMYAHARPSPTWCPADVARPLVDAAGVRPPRRSSPNTAATSELADQHDGKRPEELRARGEQPEREDRVHRGDRRHVGECQRQRRAETEAALQPFRSSCCRVDGFGHVGSPRWIISGCRNCGPRRTQNGIRRRSEVEPAVHTIV